MKHIKTQTEIKVPFCDLDPMNVVWHGNYVKYLEIARCDFFEKIKYKYEDMVKDGIIYPIAKMDLKFIKSAFMGEKLIVSVELKEVEPALIFEYEIVDAKTNEKILSAKSMQIGVNIENRQTKVEICENFKRKLDDYEE